MQSTRGRETADVLYVRRSYRLVDIHKMQQLSSTKRKHRSEGARRAAGRLVTRASSDGRGVTDDGTTGCRARPSAQPDWHTLWDQHLLASLHPSHSRVNMRKPAPGLAGVVALLPPRRVTAEPLGRECRSSAAAQPRPASYAVACRVRILGQELGRPAAR